MKAIVIKKPQQQRSKAKFSALLKASARVLRSEGFKGSSSAKIALEADVGIGTFYDYFSSKEAIFIAYLDEELNQALEAVKQQASNKDLPAKELLKKFVQAGVDFAFNEGDIIKTIATHFPSDLALINLEQSKQQLQLIGLEFAQANQGLVVNKKPELIMYSLTNVLVGFQMRIALMPEETFSRETISEEITEIIHSYLFTAKIHS